MIVGTTGYYKRVIANKMMEEMNTMKRLLEKEKQKSSRVLVQPSVVTSVKALTPKLLTSTATT